MKKLLYSLYALTLLAAVSCKDDAAAPAPQAPEANTIQFDGTAYPVKTGMVDNYGPVSVSGSEDSHYNYLFTITDASQANSTMRYMLLADLYAAGASSFTPGTFSWFDQVDYQDADVANQSVFIGSLLLDGNQDGDLDDIASGQDLHLEPTGGTVSVTGAGTNYTITYDLRFEGGKHLTGSYAGTFEYFDETGGQVVSTPITRLTSK